MLEDTFERHVVGDKFGDIPLGLYIIRGDSVVLLGEIDEAKQSERSHLKEVSTDEILELVQDQADEEGGQDTKELWNFDKDA